MLSAVLALWLTAATGGAQRPAPPVNADKVDAAARTLPRLHSLLVSRRGDVIFERYYNDRGRDRLANIKSASKSIIAALVGIALDRKLIPDLKTPIATYFPELAKDPDPRKRAITVEHLLMMRPGLEGTSNRNYGAWVTSRNWVRHALARPMFAAPGEEMEYSTGNSHLLSAILTQATGRSTWQFANEMLARPLGFSLAQWPRDPQGIYFGGNDMLMTPRQMLAFGQLYLNKGEGGRGQGGRGQGGTAAGHGGSRQRIISQRWIEQSCEGRSRNRRPGNPGPLDPARGRPNADGFVDPMRDRQYGYGWWVYEIGGIDTCFAWGYGGQYIFVFPKIDLVVVTTSSPDVSEERRGHRRVVFDILEQLVVSPLATN